MQYMPNAEALEYLLQLQQSAMEHSEKSRPVRPQQMHLTILHFGYVTETFTQINSVNLGLTRQQFILATKELVWRAAAVMPETITVQGHSLDLYGTHTNVLALSCHAGVDAYTTHSTVIAATKDFLKSCGISDIAQLPHRQRALQLTPVFNPHISLIKGYGAMDKTSLPHVHARTLQLRMFRL